MKSFFLFFLLSMILFSACKKETIITSSDALLRTSVDSLHFDSVFTSVGSVTKSFKIYNPNNQKLILSQIKLFGGNLSAFKMNVDAVRVLNSPILKLLLTILFMFLFQ